MKYLWSFILIVLFSSFNKDDVINLNGEWKFKIDYNDVGINENWFSQILTDKILLPGSMNENLKGDDISLLTKWTGSIYDSSFYFNPKLEKYRQSGNVHIPFWLTPKKHYVGAAWYQKEIVIPKNWKGNVFKLNLERAHIETRIWIDDVEVGVQNSLVAPHEYLIIDKLSPGKHRITIRIDNRLQINVGPDSHSVSDHTQGNWNGIVGDISLKAMPDVFIDEIQVYPNIIEKKAKVLILMQNVSDQNISGRLNIFAQGFNSPVVDRTKDVNINFSINSNAKDSLWIDLVFGDKMQLWDEFNPALYKLRANLFVNKINYKKEVQFGMREFRVEGRKFLINGRPVFLRGTLHNGEAPLTGYPSTKLEDWKRIFEIAKSYGLNHVRFHSWCPPEAAFEAADLVGVYLQPEGPSWPNHGVKIGIGSPVDTYLYQETTRMNKYYGNYASFVMLAAGNEPAGNQVSYLNTFVDYWKQKDHRKVYTGMSVGGSWPIVPKAEFQVRGGIRGLAWDKQPETISDYREPLAKFDVPFIAHENGQYCVFPNLNEISKYTGAYRAKNFELFKQDLIDQGMGDQALDFLMASGKLQVLCYKHDIEKILRTPDYAGFQLLGLQDFPGQGSAVVGVLDAFWEEKGYVSAKEFSKFCNSTVPLARFQKFVFHNNEELKVNVEVFHSGSKKLKNAVFNWKIVDENGSEIENGNFAKDHISNANAIQIGEISFSLNKISEPSKLTLIVEIAGTDFSNEWDFWVYPSENELNNDGDIYYATELDAVAKTILENGGKVFLNLSGKVIKGKEVAMHFLPVFWNTSWFKMRPPHVTGMLIDYKSAAFDDFPTSFHSDMQWWEIQNRSEVMILEDFPIDFKPLVQPIDTWFINRRLGLLFEANVGKGKIIVSSADLQVDSPKYASRQLYRSLVNYMISDRFRPAHHVDVHIIEDLAITPSKNQYKIYTKDSPDELKPNSNQNKL